MALQPGTTLGSYEILGPLGAGGMGEVYRARDTQLGRKVAIKVLPEGFASDPDRMGRFEREAKLLASLNHPNIATLFGYSSEGDTHFLTMELVEGETLAERLARGPLSIEETLPLFLEIAIGLEAAHHNGVIHRDLKPANVKITEDESSGGSRVKILDFGLAKAMVGDESSSAPDQSLSQTLTMGATQRGEILGTAAYMSPEQAKGRPVDRRTDVWAFGVCLHEALTGGRIFQGEDAPDTLAAVLRADLDWRQLPAETPASIRRLLRRCLERDARERLHDIADARIEIRDAMPGAAGGDDESGTEARDPARPVALPWVLFALALAALLATVAVSILRKPAPTEARVVRSVLSAAPSPAVDTRSGTTDVAISPDGTRIVYSGNGLFGRALDELGGALLPGTEAGYGAFFSADGAWVGFVDRADETMKKVSVLGGPTITLCALPQALRGASWGADDVIVFSKFGGGRGLYRVSAAGGEVETLTRPDAAAGEIDHRWPQFLPDGKTLLFSIAKGASNADTEIALFSLETGKKTVLLRGGSYPSYAPSGHLIYGSDGTLMAVAFDLDRLEIVGDPLPVLDGVVTKGSGAANFAISQDGSLVYVVGDPSAGLGWRLLWVDRQGHEEAIAAPVRDYVYPRISPDGGRVAIDLRDEENDVWIWDFTRETLTRLTFDAGGDAYPVWTADGRHVIFSSSRSGSLDIYWRPADGSGRPEQLYADPQSDLAPYSMSPDGRELAFRDRDPDGRTGLAILSMSGESRARTLLDSEFDEINAEISPDGSWLAYESDDSGRYEVYVRPLADVDQALWQISTTGGTQPLWSRDGREIFYRSPDGDVMVVAVETVPAFRPGPAELVLETQSYWLGSAGRTYDVSPDGHRFLMIQQEAKDDEASTPARVVLVQNWLKELERLVPTR